MSCWTSKPVSELLIDPTRGVCSRCPQAAQNTACARLAVPHLSQKSVGVIISLHKILHLCIIVSFHIVPPQAAQYERKMDLRGHLALRQGALPLHPVRN